jgi:A/G-specific adenine glycosylase
MLYTINAMKKQSWMEKDKYFVARFREKIAAGGLTAQLVRSFSAHIYRYYTAAGRHDLAWRKTRDPYHILVSEIMLQQTQVERVIKKYAEFLAAFPDLTTLAQAPLAHVMKVWQGMGYNRRALALQKAARIITDDLDGKVPSTVDDLRALPGIGAATASEIAAFAFNVPVVFIETNIRTVYIHFFFDEQARVHDDQLLPLIERTLDTADPRQWYYALMDYGVMLKREYPDPGHRSVHYKKQSAFKGSDREIRGGIVKLLTMRPTVTLRSMVRELKAPEYRVRENVKKLQAEGLVTQKPRGCWAI